MQEAFGQAAAAAIGFDFDRGRLDVTAHPFCTTLGPHDCRITTRYDEHFFNAAFFGILHEAGHGIYEQGLPPDQFGLPLGEAVSLGIHESQSRLWENLVGRSRPFWQHFYPRGPAAVPRGAGRRAAGRLLLRHQRRAAVADPRRGRRGHLQPAHPHPLRAGAGPAAAAICRRPTLPAAWNEKYRQYLGIVPPTRRRGRAAGRPLERRAWSATSPPTRWATCTRRSSSPQADRDLGGLARPVRPRRVPAAPRLAPRKDPPPRPAYTAAELVQRVTGRPLSSAPLLAHLRAKYGQLYGV